MKNPNLSVGWVFQPMRGIVFKLGSFDFMHIVVKNKQDDPDMFFFNPPMVYF